ncbi:DNA-binding protein [Janibacter melonis]|nr:DNA-binding protein [Janibacter melonis]
MRTPAATLRYWRHTGTGPKGFKLGGRRVMYRRQDVDTWLTEQMNAEQHNRTA